MRAHRRLILPAAAAILVAAVLLVVVLNHAREGSALFASGTVEATEARLGFQAAGRIERVLVREGDTVRAGAELAFLDRAETEARREQARAQVRAAEAQLLELTRGYRPEEVQQAKAAMEAAEQRYEDATRDRDRTGRLKEGGAVSQEALDKAQVAYDVAKSAYEQARDQYRLLESGPRRERIEAARAQVHQAEAAVRAIDALLANLTARSAFDGVVTVRHREPGEIIAAGSPVLTVMNRDDRWVRIYVPETRIGAVRLGLPAAITTDTFRRKVFHGEVSYISSEAEFTPKAVQTSEERVKLVYAVKVRITDDPGYGLKPGMPADVRLDLPGR
ncbi:MAG TPA: efflux RND transporter periplasmic adaptor subunit [Candidatus Eisenbacteria bacterium]|jgi:HlyD family secretion protein